MLSQKFQDHCSVGSTDLAWTQHFTVGRAVLQNHGASKCTKEPSLRQQLCAALRHAQECRQPSAKYLLPANRPHVRIALRGIAVPCHPARPVTTRPPLTGIAAVFPL